MPCLWCHNYCGDQSFCGPDCYEKYEEAMEEYKRWSAANEADEADEGPQNEWCGSRGNNT